MIDGIKRMLEDSCLETEHVRTERAVLKEKEKEAEMQVTITGLPDGALVIDIPRKGGAHNAMLKQDGGTRKFCDFLVLMPNEDGIHAYFIEMKKTLDPERDNKKIKHACEQILCTIPVLDYIVSMAWVGSSGRLGEKPEIQRHYYTVIAEKTASRLDKQKVKPDKPAIRDHRGRRFKIIHSLSEIPVGQLQ